MISMAHLTIAVALLGWIDISIQPSKSDRLHSAYMRSVATLDKPSERTVETLKRNDLESRYRKDVPRTLESLERLARAQPDADIVYALAELSWIEGRRLDKWKKAAAVERYLDAVAYAYDFLFDPDLAAGRTAVDPRFRLACDLYNSGLERVIRIAGTNVALRPGETIKLKVGGREQTFKMVLGETPWTNDDVDQVIMAADYEVIGVNAKTYQYGLGVPMIGIRRGSPKPEGVERFYAKEMAFPLTAFLKPTYRLRDSKAPVEEMRECTLEMIDPVKTRMVGDVGTEVPVESDLTTPLGYMWSKTDMEKLRWAGFLRPGEVLDRAGLMLIRPYEPNKIPIVMVHGLGSSPLAWIPMVNDLLRDPRIFQNYQFMLYVYPTGIPLPITTAGLRRSLREAEALLNPGNSDPQFSKMVLLGHSMGGLLSHSMVVSSDDKWWQLSTDRPFSEISGPPKILNELKEYMFFEPLPFVRRVVFLAVPHRGVDLSRNVVGRLGSSLINEPDHISKLLTTLIRDNPDAFDRRRFRNMPTSIENLATNYESLLALLAMRTGPNVTYHSIIGAVRPGPVPSSTDGVVPYTSSRFDGVSSEKVVRSDHGVQKDPEAILEVRRILLDHIGLTPQGPATASAPAGSGSVLKE